MSTKTETDAGTKTAPPASTAAAPAIGPASAPAAAPAVSSAARAAIAAQLTGRTNRPFYFVVLVVALVGSSTAAREWLIEGKPGQPDRWWYLPVALVAVAVYELGAVAVSRFADQRRQLGERALVARVASAALAGGAISAQFLGHDSTGPAVFFAGVSLTGYVIYLLEAAASRRDALRRDGKLADTPPAYGAGQWWRHPWLTRRARALALANAEIRLQNGAVPALGRVASLEAAGEQVRAEKRLAAIEAALRTRIAEGVDPTMATIAVNTYSLPRVAEGIAAAADYPALVRIITSELVPARLVKLTDAEDQGATVAAAAIVEQVTAAVAEASQAPAAELPTASVPPVIETGPAPAETEPAAAEPEPTAPARTFRLEPLPAPLSSILGAGQPAASSPPATAETAPVPTIAPALPAAETEASPAGDAQAADQGGTGETDDETEDETDRDVLAIVDDKLVPLMLKVIEARGDWAIAIGMPPRHPDGLTISQIQIAAETGSRQYGVQIARALRALAANPETAEAAIRSRGLTTTTAN